MNKKSTIAILQKEDSKTEVPSEGLLISDRIQIAFLNQDLAPQLLTLLEGQRKSHTGQIVCLMFSLSFSFPCFVHPCDYILK